MVYKNLAFIILVLGLMSNRSLAIHTISQPGFFYLIGNQTYGTSDPNDAIIVISSSNVVLDLQTFSIDQEGVFPGCDGILINPNLSNITIKNGGIKNLTGVGIHVSDGCTGINIEHIKISGCNTAGILYDGSTTGINLSLLQQVNILTCTGSGGNPAYGLRAINSANINAITCLMAYNDAGLTTSGFGLSLESCTECAFGQCLFTNNGGSNLAAGVALNQCNNCVFEGCITKFNTAHDLAGSGSACGIFINQSSGILFNLCDSNNNLNILPPGYASMGALVLSSTSCIFRDSVFEFNRGARKSAGINLFNTSQTFIDNCILRTNTTTISGFAYGLYLQGSVNDMCHIINSNYISNSGISGTFGILDDRNPSTNVILNNFAYNNGTNYSVTYPIGVILPRIIGSMSALPGLPTGQAGKFDNIDITP
jgi:hypothetical protein